MYSVSISRCSWDRLAPRVKAAANTTGAAATQVLGAAGTLSTQSEQLSHEVDLFLAGVKAA